MSGNQPASKIETYFPITAAIWKNENSEGRAWYSVTIERRYKDQAGTWQSTSSFGIDDLLTVAKVADLAHGEIYNLQATDRKAAQREPNTEG